MFDFIKPEVSGFKNVLNGYFAFKAQTGFIDDESELLKSFAVVYYQQRLGAAVVGDQVRALQMYNFAMRTAEAIAEEEGRWTLLTILRGLLAAEGMDWQNLNYVALRKASFKYQAIPQEISGL